MDRRHFLKNSMAATALFRLSGVSSPFFSSDVEVSGKARVAVLLVDTDRVTTPIDKRIYGHFLEHINAAHLNTPRTSPSILNPAKLPY